MAKQAAKKSPEKRGMNADRKNGKAFKKHPKTPRKTGRTVDGYSPEKLVERAVKRGHVV